MLIGADQIRALVPHSGKMCLLERVLDWDEQSIRCETSSHLDMDNPLRRDGRLSSICGIEYAAQAMAIHGALLDDNQESPSIGYLAALRSVKLEAESLHQEKELHITCRRLGGDANGFIYEFEVNGASTLLLSGRATVIKQRSEAAENEPWVPAAQVPLVVLSVVH